MMKLHGLQYHLNKSNIAQVGRDTGLHFNTLYGIANGKKINPSYNVVNVLSEYFSKDKRKCTSIDDHKKRVERICLEYEFADCENCIEKYCFYTMNEIFDEDEIDHIMGLCNQTSEYEEWKTRSTTC
jgi:hypothetical protein